MKKNKKVKTIVWITVCLVVLVVAFFVLQNIILKAMYPLDYSDKISAYAKQYNLDPYFVASVIWAESGYKKTAVSSQGAIGLMQVMPDTGKWIAGKLRVKSFDSKQLNDPETNIQFGCWYLRYLKNKLGDDLRITLAAYNAGPTRVQQWLNDKTISKDGVHLDNIPYDETHNYVQKIERAYDIYKKLYKIE